MECTLDKVHIAHGTREISALHLLSDYKSLIRTVKQFEIKKNEHSDDQIWNKTVDILKKHMKMRRLLID